MTADETTFTATGAEQTHAVPASVSVVRCLVDGAGGGDGGGGTNNTGAAGGYAEARFAASDETLYVYVGEGGANGSQTIDTASGGAGGWPSGGDGGDATGTGSAADSGSGGGGGGPSDVRQGGNGVGDRVIIAGGGGGGGGGVTNDGGAGGAGGGTQGADGGDGVGASNGGAGGTQSTGNAQPTGDPGDDGAKNAGGGAGGGYWGGFGGGGTAGDSGPGGGGGGGGSGFLDPALVDTTLTQGGGAAAGTDGQIVIRHISDPTGLSVDATRDTEIDLSWNAVTDADEYNVYRATSSGSGGLLTDYTEVASGVTGTTHTDAGLDNGEQYFYRVTAVDNGITVESGGSNEVSGTTTLPAPTNLTVDAHDADSIDVSWTDNAADEHGYRLLASFDGGGFSQNGGDLAIDATSGTYSGLLNGEEYTLKVRAFTEHVTSDSATVTQTTDLPDAQAPTLDNTTEDQTGVSWTDVINNGEYDLEYRETGAMSWITASGSPFSESTTSTTITGLEDGEQYDVRLRTRTEHTTGSFTTVQGVTLLPAPTAFSAPQPDWFETLSVSTSWTDNSDHTDEEYYIQSSTDGGSSFSRLTSDLGTDATSTTLDDNDLNYDTTYELRAEVATEHVTAKSASVTVVTPPVDINAQSGFWLVFVSGDSSADQRRAETDTVLGRTIDFAREHTTKSDFETSVAYDETLESEVFSECHLLFDSEHLFAGEVHNVKSDEEAGTTTISGDGAPAAQLERGEASVNYTSTLAYVALQDYLDNHANLSGTVTNPEGAASTVDDLELQSADTSAEFNSIIPAGEPGDSDAWAETGAGAVEPLQTCFTAEAENWDTVSGADAFTADRFSGNGVPAGEGEAARLDTVGEWFEHDFTPDHDIPAADFGIGVRIERNTGGPDLKVTIDGPNISSETLFDATAGTGTVDWSLLEASGSWSAPSADLLDGNTYTVRYEASGSASAETFVDVVAPRDTGGSRFTPNYTFDNTLTDGSDGGTYLDGPELFPESVRAAFAEVTTAYRITAVSLAATMDDTSNGQALGWSIDGGSTWNDTGNTASVTDDAVGTPATAVRGSVVLSRFGSRDTATPRTGFNPQTASDWSLTIDGDTVGVLEDETVNGDHLENIQRLAKRAGVRFYLTHDADEANWTVEAFAEGDRYQTADWDTLNRTRTVSVEGYANRIVGYGALQGDGTRLRVALDDTSEQSAFGQTIERTFTDPSITSTAALRSEVRTRLSNAVDEDSLVGIIDVVPIALTPGVSYQVEAWNGVYDGRYGHETYGGSSGGEPPTLAAERITYRQGRTDGLGRLHFETPGGLGDAVSSVERRAREIGDAV